MPASFGSRHRDVTLDASVKVTDHRLRSTGANHMVGHYVADYSEVPTEKLDAIDSEFEVLVASSTVLTEFVDS